MLQNDQAHCGYSIIAIALRRIKKGMLLDRGRELGGPRGFGYAVQRNLCNLGRSPGYGLADGGDANQIAPIEPDRDTVRMTGC